MANLGALLKEEIARLCRREIRKEIDSTRKASTVYRRDIAALKRKVAELERKSAQMSKFIAVQTKMAPVEVPEHPVRFVAKGFRAHRARLGLSAPQMAKLLGVSEQSVYNWETGHTRPRKDQMAKIVAARAWRKREAHDRLRTLAND